MDNKLALDKLVAKKKTSNIILGFANFNYLPIFEIWYDYFSTLGLNNLIMVALDKKMHNYLTERKIDSFLCQIEGFQDFISTKQSKAEKQLLTKLWLHRLKVIQHLLNNGVNVIHTDCDAVWLQNIYDHIKDSNKDIEISRGVGHPRAIVQRWGFSCCCGFFYIKSNNRTRRFMNEWIRIADEVGDDQSAFNKILFVRGIKWRKNKDDLLGVLPDFNVTINVITDSIISRFPKRDISVFHPFLVGSITEKKDKLLSYLDSIRIHKMECYSKRNPVPKLNAKYNLLYIHIPKAGGTSIQKMFNLGGRGHIRITDVKNYRKYFSFAVVRNPYSRLVSAFFYLSDRNNLPKWDHKESEFVLKYNNNFKQFVKDFINRTNIYRSIHLHPQYFFVCDKDKNILADEVIKLERLDRDIKYITEKINFKDEIEVSTENISTHKNYKDYFDEETKEIVKNAYAEDFILFDYEF